MKKRFLAHECRCEAFILRCHIRIVNRSSISRLFLSYSEEKCQLPLGFFALLKLLENSNTFFQSIDPLCHRSFRLGCIVSQLGIKIFTIGCSRHRSTEHRFDHKGVMWLERASICVTEGVSQLLFRLLEVVTKSLGGEVKAAARPTFL